MRAIPGLTDVEAALFSVSRLIGNDHPNALRAREALKAFEAEPNAARLRELGTACELLALSATDVPIPPKRKGAGRAAERKRITKDAANRLTNAVSRIRASEPTQER